MTASQSATEQSFFKSILKDIRKEWQLYSLFIIPIIFYIIFKYLPMAGNIIAFRKYRVGSSMFGDKWMGLMYFKQFMGDPFFWRAFGNTLRLSGTYLIIRFPVTLIFVLMINEFKSFRFKKAIQTISYLPHFISIVIVVGMINELLTMTGPINTFIKALGGQPILFMAKPEWFPTIYVGSGLWKNLGWGSILYLAALANVNPELYEAAKIDGANRLRQIWHVTLPGILPTVVTLLVLDIGKIMNANFEKVLLLYNPLTYEKADIISTYIYRMGLGSGNFSYSTAIGFFEAFIGMLLIVGANALSRKLTDSSLW